MKRKGLRYQTHNIMAKSKKVKFKLIKGKGESKLPLIIEPNITGIDLPEWAAENKEFINERLTIHGAVLFRGFSNSTIETFKKTAEAVSDEIMDYKERSSPRHSVKKKVYTSTDYPPDQKIFPHNEHSYSKTFPRKLFFYCSQPARKGGETPILDCRQILNTLKPETIRKFKDKKWMYVRNFGEGFGLPWETVFQTNDKQVVEEYCKKNLIEFEWREGNRLRTKQVRPVIINHPISNEEVWFNHMTFFNIHTLNKKMQKVLLDSFDIEDLPNNTYYGDGSPIDNNTLNELKNAYTTNLVSFK